MTQSPKTEQPPPSKSLARVSAGGLCAGCGACVQLCPDSIEMQVSGSGFLRPHQIGVIDRTEDQAINRVCPGLTQAVDAGERTVHPLWGPYREMQIGWATDPEIRYRGSSGGVLSALLAWMIEKQIVAGALANTADRDRAIANQPLVIRSRADVLAAAGSRYAPSSPLASLPKEERPLAFVGKPCDAAAFRALAMEDNSLDERFPVVLSFFCAGVPSLSGGEEVLAALGVAPENTVRFRYRGHGWPGFATAETTDGKESSMSYHDSWGKILSRHVQHRCKLCADGTGKAADIVCADAWESDEAGYPKFTEGDGISLVVARTEKGSELIKLAIEDGAIETSPFDVKTLAAIQPGQSRRRQALLARLLGQRLLGRPIPKYRGLGIVHAAKTGSPKWLAKNLLGTIRRGLAKRPE